MPVLTKEPLWPQEMTKSVSCGCTKDVREIVRVQKRMYSVMLDVVVQVNLKNVLVQCAWHKFKLKAVAVHLLTHSLMRTDTNIRIIYHGITCIFNC